MRCRVALVPRARRIALVLLDVDGVMTDGSIAFTEGHLESKTFDARDGVGLWLARRAGLRTGLISGRTSAAVVRRAGELGMDEVHLRVRDKLTAYERILRRLQLRDAQVCYIGDDLVDLPVLGRAGMPVTVADARPEVLRAARFVTEAPGGRGAVREVIDAILKAQGKWGLVMSWFGTLPGKQTDGRRARPRGGRRRTR
jgi:3-deoxy-D-manno-octulosonate 8-phosphate phosphatase (KDO 8-P phosphatase)